MAQMNQDEIQEQPTVEAESIVDDEQKPLYNKIQMADVVKREKEKAFRKGQQMAMEELKAQQAAQAQDQQQQAQAPQQPQQAQSLGGMPQLSQDEIRRMVAEATAQAVPQHLQNHSQQLAAQRQAESFVQKMQAAEARYPGLEKKLEELDWTHLGPVIRLVDGTGKEGEVMKELVENPMKMGNLLTLAHSQPNMAKKAMQDLVNSITQNQQAQAQDAQAPDPLDQMTPSTVGSDTGTKGSVRDFKNRYRG